MPILPGIQVSTPPRRRNRRAVIAAAPPVVQVMILGVSIADDFALNFSFSAPVNSDGGGSGDIVVLGTNLGDVSPVTSLQLDDATVRFEFDPSVVFTSGLAWEVNGVPACLDLLGAAMPVPQSGTVG